MGRFAAGFIAASVLWAAAVSLYEMGPALGEATTPSPDPPQHEVAGQAVDATKTRHPRARHARRARGRRRSRTGARGVATTGDDLGSLDPRSLDLGAAGGEARLTDVQIEAGMNRVFTRVRRCLVLAAGDEPVTGRLVFGVRIEPSGSVSRVNLSGPGVVSRGECGRCLRAAVRSIRFPSFDGPAMVAHYPLSLD